MAPGSQLTALQSYMCRLLRQGVGAQRRRLQEHRLTALHLGGLYMCRLLHQAVEAHQKLLIRQPVLKHRLTPTGQAVVAQQQLLQQHRLTLRGEAVAAHQEHRLTPRGQLRAVEAYQQHNLKLTSALSAVVTAVMESLPVCHRLHSPHPSWSRT